MGTVGDYEYNSKDVLGQGGFGIVYRGHHKTVIFELT
jgi:serine/threonine protein kinase